MRAPIVLFALVGLAATVPAAARDDARAGAVLKEKCARIGDAFHRLTLQRDAGVPADAAVDRVEQRLNEAGRTGSHTKTSFQAVLTPAAKFVYANPQLSAPSLANFGLSSCRLQGLFAGDPGKSSLAVSRLLKATAECQARHGGEKRNNAVGLCVADRRDAIARELRDATVELRETR